MHGRFRLPAYLPTIIIGCAILWLTLAPKPTGEMSIRLFPHQDKVAHALMFGALTWAWCYDRSRAGHRARPLLAALVVTAIGGIIEMLQEAEGLGRTAEWADLAADAVGAFSSMGLWIIIRKIPPNS